MLVIAQLVGARLILMPFAGHQLSKLSADAPGYLWPNLIGSAALAVLASTSGQWGFLLLEEAWAAITARSILRPRAAAPQQRESGSESTASNSVRQNPAQRRVSSSGAESA
jgi:hypothetical protein